METIKYSIVIPIYNEEETFPELVKQASEVMDLSLIHISEPTRRS